MRGLGFQCRFQVRKPPSEYQVNRAVAYNFVDRVWVLQCRDQGLSLVFGLGSPSLA